MLDIHVLINYHYIQITIDDNGHIFFPSITFCKFYMLTDNGVLFKKNMIDLPTSHRRKSFVDRTWSRNQLFRTVSHNTIDGTYTSPCTTFRGPKMGSPCTFPFIYPDCSECFKSLYTVIHKNLTFITFNLWFIAMQCMWWFETLF